eukprot:COSAG06_NODE_8680_length_2098_cov_3.577289_1_plen_589_part_10
MDRYYADGAEEPQLCAYYAESADYSAFVDSDSDGGAPDWHKLAAKGTLPQLRAAVEAHGAEGLSVASTDWREQLPIHRAAQSNKSAEAVRYLAEQGGAETLAAKDGRGRLAIHRAAQSNKSVEAVRYLVEQGGAATLTAKDENGRLAIHCAAESGKSAEELQYLVKHGGVETLMAKDGEGRLAIHASAHHSESMEMFRYQAEQEGGAELVLALNAALSDYSAFVESGSDGGAPDWHALAKKGTLPQLRAAVEAHGADGLGVVSTGWQKDLPIHRAAQSSESAEAVRYLVEQGGAATLTAKDVYGRLAIHAAAESSKSVEAVRYLVEQGGADTLTAKDGNGKLAIHRAAQSNKSVEVVRYLVEQGGAETLTAKDVDGKLAIHYAAEHSESAEVVRYLVEQGGAEGLTATDGLGRLAIHCAAESGKSVEAVRYLVEQGGAQTLTAKDVEGRLAIHLAAQYSKSAEVVRCLAELGPSTLELTDNQGRDALTLAKSSRHKAVQLWANTHGCELGRYRVDDDQIHHRCAPNTRRRASPLRCFPHACFFASMHARVCCANGGADTHAVHKTSCKAYPQGAGTYARSPHAPSSMLM